MNRISMSTLMESLSIIQDPRMDRTKKHELIDIMVIAICSVIGGSDSWTDIEMFGNSKKDWFERFLDIPNGIPSHDTFGRVFSMIDSTMFEACFMDWTTQISELARGEVVAIDGKTVRGSHDNGKRPIHLVSAWASENRLILGQMKVNEKSNEITAIPDLLDLLDISDCVVTIDAMGCQKEIAQRIVEKDADYVLALKRNQSGLLEDVVDTFDQVREDGLESADCDWFESVEKSRGRIEKRSCWTVSDPEIIAHIDDRGEWKNLRSVSMLESERTVRGETTLETRYYISSLGGEAERILGAARGHWGIENSVHWVLDVSFGEDASRVRRKNAAENLAIVRRMALNMLRADRSVKVGVAAKRKIAGWDTDYLLKVIGQ